MTHTTVLNSQHLFSQDSLSPLRKNASNLREVLIFQNTFLIEANYDLTFYLFKIAHIMHYSITVCLFKQINLINIYILLSQVRLNIDKIVKFEKCNLVSQSKEQIE